MLEVERVNDMLKSNGKADDYYLGNAHPSLQPIARRSKNMGDIYHTIKNLSVCKNIIFNGTNVHIYTGVRI